MQDEVHVKGFIAMVLASIFFGLLAPSNLPAQTLEWARMPLGYQWIEGVAAANDGGAWITGAFSNSSVFGVGEANETTLTCTSTMNDPLGLYLARYDSKGRLMFARQCKGPGRAGGDVIAVTPDGEVYVAGDIYGTVTFGPGEPYQTDLTEQADSHDYHYGDAFVAKYRSNGTLEWVRQIGGPVEDEIKSIAVADDGGLWATGTFQKTANFDGGTTGPISLTALTNGGLAGDMFVAKYQSDGTLEWVRQGGGPMLNVVGFAVAPAINGGAWAAAEYDEIWDENYYDTVILNPGRPDQVVLTKSSLIGQYGHYLILARYGSDGSLTSVRRITSAGTRSMSRTADGNLLVAGTFSGSGYFDTDGPNPFDLIYTDTLHRPCMFLAEYHDNGSLAWARQVAFSWGYPVMTIAPDRSIWLAGTFANPAGFGPNAQGQMTELTPNANEIYIAKYGKTGILEQAIQEGGQDDQYASGIAVTRDGGLLLAGQIAAPDYAPFWQITFSPGTSDQTTLSGLGNAFLAKFRIFQMSADSWVGYE